MKRRLDVPFICISTLIGVLLGIFLEVILPKFVFNGLYVVIFLGVFVIAIGAVVLLKSIIGEAFANLKRVMLFVLAGLVAFIGCTILFEYLYELGGNKTKVTKGDDAQYVFLVDDSSSMYQDGNNDPDDRRYDAIEEIICNMEPATDRFAVYAFSNEVKRITEMGSENSKDYKFKPADIFNGGTMMISSIEYIIEEVCEDPEIQTRIIVLTDGVPGDSHIYDEVKASCKDKNVSVSSVGFGRPDEAFLSKMAKDTGGKYVFSNNLDELTENLGTLVKTTTPAFPTNRYLLGCRRDSTEDSFLYGFLRVLFLILLGALWTVIKLLLVGEKKFMRMSAVWSVVLCAVAALIMELVLLFAPGFGVEIICRIIFAGLWACTIIPVDIIRGVNLDSKLHSGRSNASGTIADDFASKANEGRNSKSFL